MATSWTLLIAIFVVLGILVGLLSSFLGIGGGALIVPTLINIVPQIPVQMIMATSLCFIFVNSNINNWKFYKANVGLQYKLAMKINIATVVGGLLGGIIVIYVAQNHLKVFLAIVLMIIAFRMLKANTDQVVDQTPIEDRQPLKHSKLYITGFVGGIISSMTGLGGGAIFVPLLINYLKVPMKKVSPYSNLAMAFATFSGLIPQLLAKGAVLSGPVARFEAWRVGNVIFIFPLILIGGALVGSHFGVKLNDKIKPKTKKIIFAVLLFILSSRILIKQFA